MATNEMDKIPFVPECEVLHEGGESSHDLYDKCEKNPGHPTFIPVKDFNKNHLPEECRNKEMMDLIRVSCDLTVKIVVRYTSKNRPDTYPNSTAPYPFIKFKGSRRLRRIGTGFVSFPQDLSTVKRRSTRSGCPCHLCKESGQPNEEYFRILINTASHLIYDDLEASCAVFECFYDSEDREGVKYLYGINVKSGDSFNEWRCSTDVCVVECVTHDSDLAHRLVNRTLDHKLFLNIGRTMTSQGVIISHPHGLSKKITIGRILHSTIPKDAPFSISKPQTFKVGAKWRLSNLVEAVNSIGSLEGPSTSSSICSCVEEGGGNWINATSVLGPACHIRRGEEYFVPIGVTFSLPPRPEYIVRFKYPLDPDCPIWFTFPPRTRLTPPLASPSGEDVSFPSPCGEHVSLLSPCGEDDYLPSQCGKNDVYIPPDCEFNWDIIKDISRCHQFTSYDIDTCTGSSGAAVIPLGPYFFGSHLHHQGSNNGLNLSGQQVVGLFKFGHNLSILDVKNIFFNTIHRNWFGIVLFLAFLVILNLNIYFKLLT